MKLNPRLDPLLKNNAVKDITGSMDKSELRLRKGRFILVEIHSKVCRGEGS